MTHDYRAYAEEYLHSAQNNLGDMFDFAVNTCGYEIDQFSDMFLVSGIAEQFGKGNPKFIAGYSGGELVKDVVQRMMKKDIDIPEIYYQEKSPEYWCGWSLSFYQWYRCRPFKNILTVIPSSRILKLYKTHHEADISRFVDTMDMLYESNHRETSLETARKAANMSREELAKRTLTSPKKIALLEMREADINHCRAITLLRFARALGCAMEDLLEI